jgi:hypothetical protein
MSKLGMTQHGYPVIARACGEDNSGVVFDNGCVYVLKTSYPLSYRFPEDGSIDEVAYEAGAYDVFTEPFLFREEAIQALRDLCGAH